MGSRLPADGGIDKPDRAGNPRGPLDESPLLERHDHLVDRGPGDEKMRLDAGLRGSDPILVDILLDELDSTNFCTKRTESLNH